MKYFWKNVTKLKKINCIKLYEIENNMYMYSMNSVIIFYQNKIREAIFYLFAFIFSSFLVCSRKFYIYKKCSSVRIFLMVYYEKMWKYNILYIMFKLLEFCMYFRFLILIKCWKIRYITSKVHMKLVEYWIF